MTKKISSSSSFNLDHSNTSTQTPHSQVIPENSTRLPKIGFLASYNGSSMQAIVKEILAGNISASAEIIVSNNLDARALKFAKEHNIASAYISRKTQGTDTAVDEALVSVFAACDWIILSGYMRPIGPKMLEKFSQKIFNIHPSLLPAFSGQGMYGRKIHEAVIKAGVNQTGITIHNVDDGYDTGRILAQMPIPISIDETVDSLEEKIKSQEPGFFAQFVRQLCQNMVID